MTHKSKDKTKIVTKVASKWKERAKSDRANRKQISRAQKFALELMDYLDDNNISQKALAQLMGVTPQQINKILRAKSNLTFETLDKIEEALGITLSSPVIISHRQLQSKPIAAKMQVVYKSVQKKIEENYSKTLESKKNSILETTLDNVETLAYTAEQI